MSDNVAVCPHRLNEEGSYDSICRECFATVVRGKVEDELAAVRRGAYLRSDYDWALPSKGRECSFQRCWQHRESRRGGEPFVRLLIPPQRRATKTVAVCTSTSSSVKE